MRLHGITKYFTFVVLERNKVKYREYGCVCGNCLNYKYDDCLCKSVYGKWKIKQFPVLQTNETMDTDTHETIEIDANETTNTNIHDIEQIVPPLLPLTDPIDVNVSYSPSRAQTRARYQYIYNPLSSV